jgi:hypothetical protein
MKILGNKLGISLGVFALAALSAMQVHAQTQAQGSFAVSQTQLAVGRKFVSAAPGDISATPGQVVVVGGRETANSSGRVEVLTIAGGRVTGIQGRAALQGELRDLGAQATCPSGVIVQFGGSENSQRSRVANEAIGVTASGQPRGTSFLTEPSRFTTGGVVEAVGDRVFAISGDGAQAAVPTVEAFDCTAINLNAAGGNRGAVAGAPRIARAAIPTPVTFAGSESLGGKIFVTGGRMSRVAGPAMNNVQIYDAASNTWTAGTPLTVGRFGHAMAKLNDTEILIMGGSDGQRVLTSTEILNTQTGQLSAGPDMPARFGAQAVNVGLNQIIVIGGSEGMGDNDPALRTILEFSR